MVKYISESYFTSTDEKYLLSAWILPRDWVIKNYTGPNLLSEGEFKYILFTLAINEETLK